MLADWLDDNQALVDQISCAANLSAEFSLPAVKARANYTNMTHCTPITARELAKHHYIKCLLGYSDLAILLQLTAITFFFAVDFPQRLKTQEFKHTRETEGLRCLPRVDVALCQSLGKSTLFDLTELS